MFKSNTFIVKEVTIGLQGSLIGVAYFTLTSDKSQIRSSDDIVIKESLPSELAEFLKRPPDVIVNLDKCYGSH